MRHSPLRTGKVADRRLTLGYAEIQVMPACERRLPALPVLTYFKYAPLRFSEAAILGSASPESRHILGIFRTLGFDDWIDDSGDPPLDPGRFSRRRVDARRKRRSACRQWPFRPAAAGFSRAG
ncbi:hypothetical protein MPL3356_200012 [Mesorhizobium plurifarium]|uniref:Uncharacterized protein n=1 Tax=Mesorhizobium plurifarium TaxID=69974 RepID=A0A090FA33_MESPL|nr:hypothetical protein MPL3356_200012 [Mesorhizobium plurifarium]CDX63096.1 hypothetical protein MPL1032_80128 [Mesorhizobium plurifarium]